MCFSASAMPTALRDALTERPGRDLDTLGVAVLGVARRARAPLAELAEVVELEPEPGEVQHRVEQHRRVAGRQHEAVAVGPVGIGRVVLHHARPQHVGERRERHRRARVTGVRALHRVHRERAHDVDRPLVEVERLGLRGHARLLIASSCGCYEEVPESVRSLTAGPAPGGRDCERVRQPKTATLAVKPCRKFRPPIGPDLARAERAGQRHRSRAAPRRPTASWSGSANRWVPRPLHVKSSAPAPRHAVEQAPQVLVGGVRVAHLELHGLADLDLLADRERAGRLVDAEQVADEEVAALEVETVLVDDETDVQPLAHELAVLVARGLNNLLQPVHRGLTGELVHEVALGARDRERLADRPAALRHDGADRHVVGAHHRDRTASS